MTEAASPARVALVGNPNCGKTALFNALTGSRQKVANYAGVTVERKEGAAITPGGRKLAILDLPGTYSLRARSPDEAITRDAVLGRLAGETPPDVVVCVADATNLRLVLRLALELKQVGRPMVLALNMFDIAQRLGLAIDLPALSRELGMPIVTTVATRRRGLEELMAQIDQLAAVEMLSGDGGWHEPDPAELRDAHKQAERIMKLTVRPPARPDTITGKIDGVLLHPMSGFIVLLGLLFLMFQAVFTWAAPLQDLIDAGFSLLSSGVTAILPEGIFRSLITDGLIAGVGGVLVFLPQILILFLFILLLEDCGYMARAAFMLDKLMGGVGLHGRAFIPMLSSFACAIPGVMATRTIDSRNDRLTTILVAPLMTCSARIPVYTLIISAFIPRASVHGVSLQGLVMFALYAAGLISALLVSLVIKTLFWRGHSEPFMMEMPTYKAPDPLNVGRNLWQRAVIFMNRAGRIILPLVILVWVLTKFPGPPEGATGPAIDYSFAGMIGHALEPIFRPIGFNWQMVVALIPGMAAREVAVGALGMVYAVGQDASTAQMAPVVASQWSLATGLAFLAWYVYAPQCVATLGVVKREAGAKWMWVMTGYMFALAYAAALVTYQIAKGMGAG